MYEDEDDEDEQANIDKKWKIKIDRYRQEIIAQADSQELGWLDIPVPKKVAERESIRVPRGAFEMWSVARAGGGHLAHPWQAICSSGLKMSGDDVFHSDWMIGAGLDLDAMVAYCGPFWKELRDAAYAAKYEIEKRLLSFKCSVLLPGPYIYGRLIIPESSADLDCIMRRSSYDEKPPILLFPNAGPDYLELAVLALDFQGGIIVEKGGEMAHLVTVLREKQQGPIVRVENARTKYPSGAILCISTSEGLVELKDEPFSRFANCSNPFE